MQTRVVNHYVHVYLLKGAYHMEAETTWPPCYKLYFQIHFYV